MSRLCEVPNVSTFDKLRLECLPGDWLIRPPPKRPHVIEPYVPRRAASALIGAGNVGKSTLLVEQIPHVITGVPWRGHSVIQGDVVVLTWEDLTDDYHLKLIAFASVNDRFASAADQIRNGLRVVPMQATGYHLVEAAANGSPALSELAEAVAVRIKKEFPRAVWVIVETASRANAVSEDNIAMARLVEACEVIAHRIDVGVTVTHHVTKSAIKDGTVDATAARGGSALVDNCRATSLLIQLDKNSHRDFLPPGVVSADLNGRDAVVLISARASHARKSDAVWLERKFGPSGLPYFVDLVVTNAQRQDRRTEEDRRMLTFLQEHIADDQWHSMRSLTRDSKELHGLTETAAVAALQRLSDAGKIEFDIRPQHGDKGKMTTRYRLKADQP